MADYSNCDHSVDKEWYEKRSRRRQFKGKAYDWTPCQTCNTVFLSCKILVHRKAEGGKE